MDGEKKPSRKLFQAKCSKEKGLFQGEGDKMVAPTMFC